MFASRRLTYFPQHQIDLMTQKNAIPSLKEKTKAMKYHSGFTLLEILVALVVLAIGLLGAAGVMLNSTRMASSSYLNAAAQQFAYEITDKMRANQTGLQSGGYALASGASATYSTDCSQNTCSAADMAKYDLALWLAEVQTLPNGAGTITTSASGSVTNVTVNISWGDVQVHNLAKASASISISSQL